MGSHLFSFFLMEMNPVQGLALRRSFHDVHLGHHQPPGKFDLLEGYPSRNSYLHNVFLRMFDAPRATCLEFRARWSAWGRMRQMRGRTSLNRAQTHLEILDQQWTCLHRLCPTKLHGNKRFSSVSSSAPTGEVFCKKEHPPRGPDLAHPMNTTDIYPGRKPIVLSLSLERNPRDQGTPRTRRWAL